MRNCMGTLHADIPLHADFDRNCGDSSAPLAAWPMHARMLAGCTANLRANGAAPVAPCLWNPGSRVTAPSLHVQAIPALGVKGSVVDANAGWMRHKLFPQGRAVYATPKNIEQHSMVGVEERIRRGREGRGNWVDFPQFLTQREEGGGSPLLPMMPHCPVLSPHF